MRPETFCVLFIAVTFVPTHRGHNKKSAGWIDEQNYENCCFTFTYLGLHRSKA